MTSIDDYDDANFKDFLEEIRNIEFCLDFLIHRLARNFSSVADKTQKNPHEIEID